MSRRQMSKGKKRRHHKEAQAKRLWAKRARVLQRSPIAPVEVNE